MTLSERIKKVPPTQSKNGDFGKWTVFRGLGPVSWLFHGTPYPSVCFPNACPMPTFAFVVQSCLVVVFSPHWAPRAEGEALARKIARGRAFADSFDLMGLSLQFD
jgi:hypothetical protein